jgi:hypothetical protein
MTDTFRHPDGWAPAQITAITAELRTWLDAEDPDVSGLMFGDTLSEIVMQVWPYAYRAGYRQGRDDKAAGTDTPEVAR